LFGHSRQAFYKHQQRQFKTINQTKLIIEQVLHIRSQQPRCGARKLLIMLQPFFLNQKISIGRDATEKEALTLPTPNTSFTAIPIW